MLSDKLNKAISKFKSSTVLKFEKYPIIEFNINEYNTNKKQNEVIKFLIQAS